MPTVDSGGHYMFTRGYRVVDVVIAIDESLSGEVDLEGYALVGIVMPAAWTAANLSFAVSDASGGTFVPLYDDDGNEVVAVAAASRGIGLDAFAGALAQFRFLKVRSGLVGAAVAQVAARTLKLVCKG